MSRSGLLPLCSDPLRVHCSAERSRNPSIDRRRKFPKKQSVKIPSFRSERSNQFSIQFNAVVRRFRTGWQHRCWLFVFQETKDRNEPSGSRGESALESRFVRIHEIQRAERSPIDGHSSTTTATTIQPTIHVIRGKRKRNVERFTFRKNQQSDFASVFSPQQRNNFGQIPHHDVQTWSHNQPMLIPQVRSFSPFVRDEFCSRWFLDKFEFSSKTVAEQLVVSFSPRPRKRVEPFV